MARKILMAVAAFAGLAFAALLPAAAVEVWETLPAPKPLAEASEQGSVDAGGAEIRYAVYGSGEPLIFLHGGLANMDYWGNQVPEFADDHRVVLIDSRGHGRSTRSDATYTYELMASDVIAVMDHLKIDKASIVGWSDGGIIGLVMAIEYPDRIAKVFAQAANTNPAGLKEGIDKNPTFNLYIEQTGKEYAALSATPADFNGFVEAIGKMWATEPDIKGAELASIAAPVAIVVGEHDEAIRPEHSEAIAKAIPGAELVVLPGVSHFGMLQNPDQFNTAIRDFLAGP